MNEAQASPDPDSSSRPGRRISWTELPADHPIRRAAQNKKPPPQRFKVEKNLPKAKKLPTTKGSGSRKTVVIVFVLIGAVLFALWQARSFF